MQAYPGQGNPLMDALKGLISVRQLRVMIEHLPRPNAITREIVGNEWSDHEWFIWDIDSQLRKLNTNFINAHRGDNPVQKVELLPNPKTVQDFETRSPEQIASDRASFKAVMDRQRTKN